MAYFGTFQRVDPSTRVLLENRHTLSYAAPSGGVRRHKAFELSVLHASSRLCLSFGECLALPLPDVPTTIAPHQRTRRPVADGGSTRCGGFQISQRQGGSRTARVAAIGSADPVRHHFSQ